jgi:hypothetical protein
MLLAVWLFVGLVATLATGLALLTDDDGIAIFAGALGFVSWGTWTYGAFDIERPIEGATELTFSEPAVAILGIGLALIPGFIALTGPVEIISRYRDPDLDDI